MKLRALVFGLLAVATVFTGNLSADLFVSAASANSVMRFDGETGSSLGNFVAPGSGGLGDPQGLRLARTKICTSPAMDPTTCFGLTAKRERSWMFLATTTGMNWPAEINFRNGHLYVSDFSSGASGRVSRFDAVTGEFVDHFVTGASLADGTAWDAAGDLYVSNFGTASIRKYNGTTGALIGDFVTPGLGALSGPLDNLFLPDGTLLVSSYGNGSIKHYDSSGNYLGNAITGLNGGPQGLEIGPDGMLYAGDYGNGLVNRYDIDTFELLGTFANAASTTNNFTFQPVPEPIGTLPLLLGIVVACLKRRRNA